MTRPYDSIELIDTQMAAAKRSVNRLKRFDRSAKEHLEQHRRWFEGYVAQETRDRERHERRLRHLQLRHQRRIRRQRLIQWCKQLALAVALFVRSSGLSVLKGVVSALTYLAELLLISASWLGANVYALARLLIKLLAVSFSWVRSKAYALARSTAKLLSIGLSWSRVKARACALLLLNLASVSRSWIVARARDLASSLPKLVSATRLQARRYRRRGLALAGTLPERARVGLQGFHRSTEPMRLALKRRLVGSSTSDSGPSPDEEGSSLIPKRNDHIEPEPQHAPFQHQEPAPEHSAILVRAEKEIIADKPLTGGASSTGSIDAPRNSTDLITSMVAGDPISGMDVPTAGNESPVKARSRKRRRHRKRRRRHASHGVPCDSHTG